MEIDIKKLEEICKAITKGRWIIWRRDSFIGICHEDRKINLTSNDENFISEACNVLPELIYQNKKMKEQIIELNNEKKSDLQIRVQELEAVIDYIDELFCIDSVGIYNDNNRKIHRKICTEADKIDITELSQSNSDLKKELEEKEKYIESLENLCNVLRQQVEYRTEQSLCKNSR